MKKDISLRVLNEEGDLILSYKKVAFVHKHDCKPLNYRSGDPVTCYVHYYKDKYIVTTHVINDLQLTFYSMNDAEICFIAFVRNTSDYLHD